MSPTTEHCNPRFHHELKIQLEQAFIFIQLQHREIMAQGSELGGVDYKPFLDVEDSTGSRITHERLHCMTYGRTQVVIYCLRRSRLCKSGS